MPLLKTSPTKRRLQSSSTATPNQEPPTPTPLTSRNSAPKLQVANISPLTPGRYEKSEPPIEAGKDQSDKAEKTVTGPKQPDKPNNRAIDRSAREMGETFEEERKPSRGLGNKGPGDDTPDIADDGDLGM